MKLDLCCPWDGYRIFLNRENCVQHCENNALLGPFCPTHPTLASVQGFTPQPVVSNLMSKLPVKYFPVVVAGRVITLTWLHFKSRPLRFLMQEKQWERRIQTLGGSSKNVTCRYPCAGYGEPMSWYKKT